MSPLVIPSSGAPLAVWIFCAVQFAIIALLLGATLARRDLWPFSHYPMFAGYERAVTARYFELKFELPEGNTVGLPKQVGQWADEFDRAFAAAWPDASAGQAAATQAVQRAWRQAAAFAPALRSARRAVVTLRFAQIGAERGMAVTEKIVHTVDLGGDAAR